MDALITYGLYGVAFLLILVGVAGTIVPALPGIPMIFAGAWLIGYMEDYQYFGWGTLIALGVLTVISLIIDWVSQTMGAPESGGHKARTLRRIPRYDYRYSLRARRDFPFPRVRCLYR